MGRVVRVRVNYDEGTNTFDVWFDDPKKEAICEETVDEVILKKDKQGKVIGFEKLNFLTAKKTDKKPRVEFVFS